MNHAVVLVLATLLTLAACVLLTQGHSTFQASPAIFGGLPTSNARYPWYCWFSNKDKTKCGGSLIGKDKIMTAKHCNLKVGAPVTIGGTERRRIKSVFVHQTWDIAIVTLDRPSFQQPIRIAPRLPPNNSKVVALGRGRTSDSATPRVPDLMRVELQYVDPRTASALGNSSRIAASPAFVTATGLHKETCGGDSGGPLIIERGPGQDELLGVLARSTAGCGSPGPARRYSYFSSMPFYFQNAHKLEALFNGLGGQKCRFAQRVRRGWSVNGQPPPLMCPATTPWWTGLAEGGMQPMTQAVWPCTNTESCARLANSVAAIAGATGPRGPVQKHA